MFRPMTLILVLPPFLPPSLPQVSRIATQLGACLDSLPPRVFVVGATNRPHDIHPSLRRAGRLDKEVRGGREGGRGGGKGDLDSLPPRVFVIGATNRPQDMHPSRRRAGRLDEEVREGGGEGGRERTRKEK